MRRKAKAQTGKVLLLPALQCLYASVRCRSLLGLNIACRVEKILECGKWRVTDALLRKHRRQCLRQ